MILINYIHALTITQSMRNNFHIAISKKSYNHQLLTWWYISMISSSLWDLLHHHSLQQPWKQRITSQTMTHLHHYWYYCQWEWTYFALMSNCFNSDLGKAWRRSSISFLNLAICSCGQVSNTLKFCHRHSGNFIKQSKTIPSLKVALAQEIGNASPNQN